MAARSKSAGLSWLFFEKLESSEEMQIFVEYNKLNQIIDIVAGS